MKNTALSIAGSRCDVRIHYHLHIYQSGAIAASEAQVQEEKIKHLTSEKKAAEANLQILQAQIEPHFLFNTLSNVLNLLNTEPEKGKIHAGGFYPISCAPPSQKSGAGRPALAMKWR